LSGKQVQSSSQGQIQRWEEFQEGFPEREKKKKKKGRRMVRLCCDTPAASGLTAPESNSDTHDDGRWQVRQDTIELPDRLSEEQTEEESSV